MTTSALQAFSGSLTWNGNPVAEITDLGLPKQKVGSVRVTNEDSPNAAEEYIPGLVEGGEVSIKFNFIPGDTLGQVAMATDFHARVKRTVVITKAGGLITWTFTAHLTAFDAEGKLDGEINGSATMKISGIPVLAYSASADITTIAYEDSVGAKTSLPVFASATYGPYTVTIATASTYIKVTVTDATAATITAEALGVVHPLTTAVQSGQIIVGAAGTTTLLTITAIDTDQTAKVYTIYVVRP
jgi:hypothetical protein